jgi:hypothetical protein
MTREPNRASATTELRHGDEPDFSSAQALVNAYEDQCYRRVLCYPIFVEFLYASLGMQIVQ